jgi:hypothetical protein
MTTFYSYFLVIFTLPMIPTYRKNVNGEYNINKVIKSLQLIINHKDFMNIYSNRWSGVVKSIYTKFTEKKVLLLPVTVTNKLHARNMMVSKRKPKR